MTSPRNEIDGSSNVADDNGHGTHVIGEIAAATAAVTRLAGSDRYRTSAVISASAFDAGVPIAFIATGLNFPDALSAGPVAGRR